MTIGQNIKEARKKAGFKQTELAEMIGISVNSLRLYEGDKITPKAEILKEIAAACRVSMFYLTGNIDCSLFTVQGGALELCMEESGISRLSLANQLGISEMSLLDWQIGKRDSLSAEDEQKLINTVPPILGFSCFADMVQFYFGTVIGGAGYDAKRREQISLLKPGEKRKESNRSQKIEQESEQQQRLMTAFYKLNHKGQSVAIERLEELGKISEYRKDSGDSDAVPDSDKKTPAGE